MELEEEEDINTKENIQAEQDQNNSDKDPENDNEDEEKEDSEDNQENNDDNENEDQDLQENDDLKSQTNNNALLNESNYSQMNQSALITPVNLNSRVLDTSSFNSLLKKDSNKGVTGLQNLGNSCYLNCAIQCLSHSVDLVYYFISGMYKDEINQKSSLSNFSLIIFILY